MKTNRINLALYSPSYNAQAMEQLCDRYKSEIETEQYVTYDLVDGQAVVHAVEPVYATKINLPLPFIVPVIDLGSGTLNRIDINIDTLVAEVATCPTDAWAARRRLQQPLTIQQTLMADYIGLL